MDGSVTLQDMGVHGLWPLLSDTGKVVDLSSLEGKRLAIDISVWLCQAQAGYSAHGISSKAPHLDLLLHRIGKLLYFKVRPIFVFDGDKVPVFKRHVLRERAVKKYQSEMSLSSRQKGLLEKLAKTQMDSSQSPEKKRAVEDEVQLKFANSKGSEDIFELPQTSQAGRQEVKPPNGPSEDYLAGYERLATEDERITFLLEAKERVKTERLRLRDIPQGDVEFSKFQLERLVKRNAINVELQKLKTEKAQQFARVAENEFETVIVDPYLQGHVIRRIDPKTQKPSSSKSESASTKNWDTFLNKIQAEYDTDESETGFNYGRLMSRFAERDAEEVGEDSQAKCDQPDSVGTEKITSDKECWTPETSEHSDLDGDTSSESTSSDDFVDVSDGEQRLRRAQEQFALNKVTASVLNRVLEANHPVATIERPQTQPTTDLVEQVRIRTPSPTFQRDLLKRKMDDDSEDWTPAEVEAADLGVARSEVVVVEETERIDDSVFKDCQTLLHLLGVPYTTAPGEAEAQCVCLERLGLCDGIVTEDSDAWLFGAETVYKNMFGKHKQVTEFSAEKIYDEYGLSRAEFIAIAMLAGGDYTNGFDGVGAVTALELCAEVGGNPDRDHGDFYTEGWNRMRRIGDWLQAKRKFEAAHPGQLFKETGAKIRLRRAVERKNEWDRIEQFPSEPIFSAYARPLVDSSIQPFKWNPPQADELQAFVWSKAGWSPEDLRRRTHNAFDIWDKFMKQPTQHYQLRMTAFLRKTPGNLLVDRPMANTKRVHAALKRMQRKRGRKVQPSSQDDSDSGEPEHLQKLIERARKERYTSSRPTAITVTDLPTNQSTYDEFYDDSFLEGFQFPTSSTKRKSPKKKTGIRKQYSGPNLSEESD